VRSAETMKKSATLLSVRARHCCSPLDLGREFCLSTRVICFIWVGLATLLGISAYVLPNHWSSPRHGKILASNGSSSIPGRWVNGRYLRFEDAVVASNAELAGYAHKLASEPAGQAPSEIATDRALLALLDGKPSAAATILRKGLDRSPSDSVLLNNLAVVELASANQGNSASLIGALDALEQCLRLQPDLKEALFNRALVLEQFSLKGSARDAWSDYVSLESDVSWTEVAKKHLTYVEEPSVEQKWYTVRPLLQNAAERGDNRQVVDLVAQFPQSSRILVQEDIIPQWANARLLGDRAASTRVLGIAQQISEALLQHNGESSAADAVKEIERAEGRGRGSDLARGYISFLEGLKNYQELQPQKALPLLYKAQEIFKSTGSSSLLHWTNFWLAGTRYYLGQRQTAEAEIEELLSFSDISKYPALRGRAFWSLGLMMLVRSDFSASLQNYSAAIEEFNKLGELENLGAVQALAAENLHVLGAEDESWRIRVQALQELNLFPSSVRLHNLLSEAADHLVSSGQIAVAQYFHTEDLLVSKRIGNPAIVAEALLGRSRDLFALGHVDAAWSDMHEAQKQITEILDEPTRRRLQADASLAAGGLADATTAPVLIKDLSLAVDYYEKAEISPLAALAHLMRARVLLLLDREAEVEDDLKAATELHEAAVGAIDSRDARISYRKQWQSVFDQIIELEAVRRNNPEAAFSVLEYARSGQKASISTKDIGERLRPGEVLVEYALLPDKLLIWIVSKGSVDFVVTGIDGSRLKSLVEKFAKGLKLSAKSSLWQRSAAALSRYLIDPVVERAPNAKLWILVPDRCLAKIPFAGLQIPASGRYLIQDRSIIYEPSASRWAAMSSAMGADAEEEKQVKPEEQHLLAVGDPMPNFKAHPSLGELPGAASEVKEVANLYSQKTILLGKQATPLNFLHALRKAGVVHFAGHAVFSDKGISSSKLFLWPGQERGANPTISVDELGQLDLRHIKIFILSACETAAGGIGDREGMPGFADALLGAGVSSVVAARWEIPDQRSREFFVNLHRNLLAGETAEKALRLAQIESIRAGQGPDFWASFEIFGGI